RRARPWAAARSSDTRCSSTACAATASCGSSAPKRDGPSARTRSSARSRSTPRGPRRASSSVPRAPSVGRRRRTRFHRTRRRPAASSRSFCPGAVNVGRIDSTAARSCRSEARAARRRGLALDPQRRFLGIELREGSRELLLLGEIELSLAGNARGLDGRGLGRGEAHLALEGEQLVVHAVRRLELAEARGQRIAGELLVELCLRFRLGLHLLDLARHAIEGLERARVAQAAQRLLNGSLGFGALLPRDEEVLLALGLLDLVVEGAERELELLHRVLLLLQLFQELLAGRVVLLLARQRLLREPFVARAEREHRAPLPFLRADRLLRG